jgi:NAD(P)-dependent dehydrogenase (short-subunit alcohol dehydrogenase family)
VGDIVDNDIPSSSQNFMGHVGTPEDVANMALFLLSDSARFITGVCIAVDGGMD